MNVTSTSWTTSTSWSAYYDTHATNIYYNNRTATEKSPFQQRVLDEKKEVAKKIENVQDLFK